KSGALRPVMSRGRAIGSAAALAVALALAPAAARADGFAIDTYQPPPAGDRFFSIESAEVPGHVLVSAAAVTTFGTNPLLLSAAGAGADPEPRALVATQIAYHLGVGLAFWNRLKLSVDFPIVTGSGEDVGPYTAPSG